MPSDYIKKNSVIPNEVGEKLPNIDHQKNYSKTIKKASEQYEDIQETKQIEAELADPWEE